MLPVELIECVEHVAICVLGCGHGVYGGGLGGCTNPYVSKGHERSKVNKIPNQIIT